MTCDPATKPTLRSAIAAARRAVSVAQRRAESDALRNVMLDIVQSGATVCAYVPIASEPGSVEALDDLAAAGVRVLLPVARENADTPQPLAWGEYRSDGLLAAPFGLREPVPPRLPPAIIAAASTVFVPALAVDWTGARLGRGAGFYDRSLTLANPAARLIAVVRDDELVEELPHEDHDVPMTHALTPGRGLVPLGRSD